MRLEMGAGLASKLSGQGANALLISIVADHEKSVNYARKPDAKREKDADNKTPFSPSEKDRQRGTNEAEQEVHDDEDEWDSRRFCPTLHPQRSTLKDQPVVFDDRVRKQIATNFVKLSLRLCAIEFEFDEFSHTGAFDGRQAVVVDGIADRHSLWVEHALLWEHDYLGFHFGGQTRSEAARFKREVP
jgi:hypothetical protein